LPQIKAASGVARSKSQAKERAAMPKRILIIQGHPDPRPERLCRALAAAYAEAAQAAGNEVRSIDVAGLALPLLATQEEWTKAEPPPAIAASQQDIAWAEHIVIVYPLWLGAMPALLKGFLEQALRPGFALDPEPGATSWGKRLTGRSARIVVTMGMPALVYRWFFRAHSLKSLERNILKFVGIKPVRETLIGMVGALDDKKAGRWLEKMRALGRAGA
jgi:putative NADPH-quinone reductase